MKLLTTAGLTKLIQLIKSTFIKNTDVVEATSLGIDTTPTASSNNLVTSGGVATALSNKLPNTTKYGADLSYFNSSLQLKDQDGNALGNAVTIESSPAIDNSTITKNTSGQLQASSLVNLTTTVTELNYVDGVTSNIQTQLDNKVTKNSDITASTAKQLVTYDTKGLVTGGSTLESSDVTTALGYTPLANTIKYGADLSYSNSSLQLKDQDGNALGNAVTIESSPAIDNTSITTNSSSQLQASGVINQNDTTTALKTWSGTKAQYDAIETKDASTIYNVTDETTSVVYDSYTKTEINDLISNALETAQGLMDTKLSSVYPVGSIYIGTTDTCPMATLISGSTWELVGKDKVLQGAGSRGSVNTTLNESLPNITGRISVAGSEALLWKPNSTTQSGALSVITGSNAINANVTTTGYTSTDGISFNASNSSSTYQDNAPVQPDAYLVNIWRRTS